MKPTWKAFVNYHASYINFFYRNKHEFQLGYGMDEHMATELRNALDRKFDNITFYINDNGESWGVGGRRINYNSD